MRNREMLKDKKRIVIKVGTSTITYAETGNINLEKLEKFVHWSVACWTAARWGRQ